MNKQIGGSYEQYSRHLEMLQSLMKSHFANCFPVIYMIYLSIHTFLRDGDVIRRGGKKPEEWREGPLCLYPAKGLGAAHSVVVCQGTAVEETRE